MAYCHICQMACLDITRHLFSCHTRPEAVNPDVAAGGGASSNELEPGEVEDTFCFQCSREFHTAAALTAHLGDVQVHFPGIRNITRVPVGMPSYPSRDATGSYGLRPRSPRLSENPGHDHEGSDTGNGAAPPHALGQGQSNSSGSLDQPRNELGREYTPQDDRSSLYDASSTDQSSEELTSESDEDDDISMDTDRHTTQNHSSVIPISPVSDHAQYSQMPSLVTGDAQSPNPPYTPGAYTLTSSLSIVNPPGSNAYAQEGVSMSHYDHRSGATHRAYVSQTESSAGSSHPPQAHNASIPQERGIMCPICLESAENVTSTLCGHIFCASCIKSALSMRLACPVCNRATSQWDTHPIYPVF